MTYLRNVFRARPIFGLVMLFGVSFTTGIALPAPGSQIAAASQSGNDGPPVIADPSRWNFKRIHTSGAVQDGAFRIEQGLIYHLDMPQVVGRIIPNDDGGLRLEFLGHRKIAEGEALIYKVKDGQWHGLLQFADEVWEFDMKRRCGK